MIAASLDRKRLNSAVVTARTKSRSLIRCAAQSAEMLEVGIPQTFSV